jgi:hypothetical protein
MVEDRGTWYGGRRSHCILVCGNASVVKEGRGYHCVVIGRTTLLWKKAELPSDTLVRRTSELFRYRGGLSYPSMEKGRAAQL